MGEPATDAQFGVVRILRPYVDFEDNYEGELVTSPIMLSEQGRALDPSAEAGKDGYDPNLVRGLKVPVGARVIIWVPNVFANPALGQSYPYTYTLIWRYRNVFDYRQQRVPYHYPKQGAGVPYIPLGGTTEQRVVLPAATQSVIYNQTEGDMGPTLSLAPQNLHSEQVAFGGMSVLNPINPNGENGAFQQGVMPTSGGGAHTRALFSPHEVAAVGDEMMIAVTRTDIDQAASVWEFDGVDQNFSRMYGKGLSPLGPYPDIGVYVTVGSAP